MSDDGFIQVMSDDPQFTADQARALTQKLEGIYQWDRQELGWKDDAPLRQTPLVVEALTQQGYDAILGGNSTGVSGVTMNANLVVVPESIERSMNPDDGDTLAHELDHVQDFRIGGASLSQVPAYVQEGKAYCVGDEYPIAQGQGKQDVVLGQLAHSLTQWTAADAQDVLSHFRTHDDEQTAGGFGFRDELIGALYVEFLRLHGKGDQGFPDALARFSQVISQVGQGQNYDAAFQAAFGVSSADTEKAFIQFVQDTQADPRKRLAGTLWEPYLDPSVFFPPSASTSTGTEAAA